MIKNSRGDVYYGMHFYPGVAEYQEAGKDPYRVFLNEDTIRSMDPSFAGCPIFVEHVDEVDENLDELRKEADGWVLESFFNSADGKHWVKFIVVSERGRKAIMNGMRLSNAYVPTSFNKGGLWNGVQYAKEITGGEYEHLAIVRNPRYEESVIMTPDEFKKYNDDNVVELKRLANSKEKGNKTMKLNFFKKAKVENAIDPELSIVLPKSGRELTVVQLVNEMDEHEKKKKENNVEADHAHMVKLHDGSMCNVGELLEKHKQMHDELSKLKGNEEMEEHDLETSEEGVDSESSMENDEEDEAAKKKALELAEHEDKEIEAAKKKNSKSKSKVENESDDEEDDEDAAAKKKNDIEAAQKKKAAKEKADRLRNANLKPEGDEVAKVEFSADQVARGKARYGS